MCGQALAFQFCWCFSWSLLGNFCASFFLCSSCLAFAFVLPVSLGKGLSSLELLGLPQSQVLLFLLIWPKGCGTGPHPSTSLGTFWSWPCVLRLDSSYTFSWKWLNLFLPNLTVKLLLQKDVSWTFCCCASSLHRIEAVPTLVSEACSRVLKVNLKMVSDTHQGASCMGWEVPGPQASSTTPKEGLTICNIF